MFRKILTEIIRVYVRYIRDCLWGDNSIYVYDVIARLKPC